MEARLTALDNGLRQTERALVVERLARQTAEVAQQTVGTWPAGVDAEEIGTLPMFSGDVDSSEQTNSVPWSQWSLAIRSNFGKFNRTTAWVLQQVETSVDDPIITDNTVMTKAEKRFSAQAYCVLVLTCRGTALQVVQRVPRGFGFDGGSCVRSVSHVLQQSPKKCVKPFCRRQSQTRRCRWSVSKTAN